MNEGLKEVESSKESQRWLVIAIILTCLFWIDVWADFAFGYVNVLTICNVIGPGFLWVMIARRYEKIDQGLATLSAVFLSVIICILFAIHFLSPFF